MSPFLTDDLGVGDQVEVRGPLGGWFVLAARASPAPVLLVARRLRRRTADGDGPGAARGGSRAPFRLVYSVRTPGRPDLRRRAATARADDGGLDVDLRLHPRGARGQPRAPGRLRADDLVAHGWPPDFEPTCYVCGPTALVEAVAGLLVAVGPRPGPDPDRTVRWLLTFHSSGGEDTA